jgi:hypothetical protein
MEQPNYFEADFSPGFESGQEPASDARLARACEYAAFQLGQMNRKLDRLIAAVERLASSQPDPRSIYEMQREREGRSRE